jgi:hypothetical protein
MMLKSKKETLPSKVYLETRNFEGLILLHSLLPLHRGLIPLRQDVRSCVSTPMEDNSSLGIGFPIRILLCGFGSNLCRKTPPL